MGVKQMGKRLTEKELRERDIKNVVSKIQKLEKIHAKDIVESACYRYKTANLERRNAEKEFREAEKNLANARRKLR